MDTVSGISNPAPVCVFAFRRPDHTRRTLASLSASPLAPSTEVTVFVDGPRTDAESATVDEVARVAAAQSGFADLKVVRRERNAGLATAIEEGVSATMQAHGRAIVVEDDIVTSPAFLHYMNLALERYADEPRVWHIAGYNEELYGNRNMRGAALWRFMSCWGWASWADRWSHFQRDPAGLISRFSTDDIQRFNLDAAHDFWEQVLANDRGELNTWAVFWYATIFQNDGLCLSPHFSYAKNIGFDGSGSHGVTNDSYLRSKLNLDMAPPFPNVIVEDAEALEKLRVYYTQPKGRWKRLRRKLRRSLRKIIS